MLSNLCKQLGASASDGSGSDITVSIHEVKTLLKKTKSKKKLDISNSIHTEVYALLVKSRHSKIGLPHKFEYQDALNSWRSATSKIECDPVLLNVIENNWASVQQRVRQTKGHDLPAPHAVYCGVDGHCFEPLELKFDDSSGILRYGSPKRMYLLNIKSHKPDPKSLLNHISRNPIYRIQKVGLHNEQEYHRSPAFTQLYEKLCDDLPVSYQYPTIGINSTVLAKPNNLIALAIVPCFANPYDNNAHIVLCAENFSAIKPSKSEILKILSRVSDTSQQPTASNPAVRQRRLAE